MLRLQPALESRLSDIRLAQPGVAVPWIETMVVTSKESLSLAPEFVHDDTKREAAFYEQALECAMEGKKRVIAAGVPFSRPADYFAEMVKSDEHMERVRQSLVEESAAIKRAEEMKRLREQKKFGKKVQQATLQEREKRKKEDLNKIDKLKRKRKELAGGGGAPDDFGVDIDFSDDEKPRKKAKKGQLAEKSSKRKAKDAKYSFGGHRKFAKSNDRESLDAFDMDSKKMKAPFGAGKKFKAGKAGKTGKGGKPMRPGKSKRMAGKGKGRK